MKTKLVVAAVLALAASSGAMASLYPNSITVTVTPVADEHATSWLMYATDTRQLSYGQSFDDHYNFHLDYAANVTFSTVAGPLYSASLELLKGVAFESVGLTGPGGFSTTGIVAPGGAFAAVAVDALAPGDYILNLSGAATGSAGGNYYGNVGVQPVPEPETLALCLAGVSVAGGLALRRRARKD